MTLDDDGFKKCNHYYFWGWEPTTYRTENRLSDVRTSERPLHVHSFFLATTDEISEGIKRYGGGPSFRSNLISKNCC